MRVREEFIINMKMKIKMKINQMMVKNQMMLKIILVHTSSTAQGSGSSFKNREPIGEVGCCESWMGWQSECTAGP